MPSFSPQDTDTKSRSYHSPPPPVVTAAATADEYRPHDDSAAKHWGEVVINPRKKRPKSAGKDDNDDVFGVLKVT